MPWLLLDLALVLLALVAVAVCALRLWSGVKRLSGELGRAGSAIGAATDALAVVQTEAPDPPSGAVAGAPQPGRSGAHRATPARRR